MATGGESGESFEEATTAASSNHTSATIVIPSVISILCSLQEGTSSEDSAVTRIKKEILSLLISRYSDMEVTNIMQLLPYLMQDLS